MCEICSKLAVNIPERRQWRSGVLIMKFKQISLRFHKFANTLVEAARSAIFTLIHISPVLGLYTPWKHLVSIAPCEGVQKFNLWKNLVTIKQKLVVSCPFPPGRHKTLKRRRLFTGQECHDHKILIADSFLLVDSLETYLTGSDGVILITSRKHKKQSYIDWTGEL